MHTRLGSTGRALAVTVTAAMALGLAGCGDQGSSAGSGGAGGEKNAKVEQADALSKDEIMTAAYDASLKAGSAHMEMTVTANGQEMSTMAGDVTYADQKTAMQATMSSPQQGPGKMEIRYVGKIVYLQIPGTTPAGKFIRVDPADPSSPMAKAYAGLSDQMDPMASLKTAQAAVVSAKLVGTDTVQGVAVDRYRVVVDTAKMLAKQDPAIKAQMPKTVTYEMALDKDNLVRQMTFDVAGTKAKIEMSDWGKPVKVERPAASDIVKEPQPTA
jgi:lipoprotein LprG